jgi:hypothetical protein
VVVAVPSAKMVGGARPTVMVAAGPVCVNGAEPETVGAEESVAVIVIPVGGVLGVVEAVMVAL